MPKSNKTKIIHSKRDIAEPNICINEPRLITFSLKLAICGDIVQSPKTTLADDKCFNDPSP